jgi:hypothetical protein
MHKLAAEQCCKVDGSSTCLPEDHQDAREYIVSRNDGFDLLDHAFSWKGVGKKGRLLGIKMEHFNQNLTVIPFGFVEGLNWWVFGKTKKLLFVDLEG